MAKHSALPAKTSAQPFPLVRTDMLTGWQREVDRLFDDFRQGFDRLGHLTPRLDMSESPTELEITAELPGLEEKDVEIGLSDDVLTISGEKQAESEQKDRNRHMVERSYGSFSRSVRLPHGVGASDISASLAKGVLKVVVRKPAPNPSTKIQIKTAD